tara:strand:+ start:150 stop:1781 length:1632 start_codon:yes stop_codon:yes gene_type:complete
MIFTECGILLKLENKPHNILNFLDDINRLQHRGRDSIGISYVKQNNICTIKQFGTIDNYIEKINSQNINISSNSFLGHVRYSTSGGKKNINLIQPILININYKNINLEFNIAFNGNIPKKVWYNIYSNNKDIFSNIDIDYFNDCNINKKNDDISAKIEYDDDLGNCSKKTIDDSNISNIGKYDDINDSIMLKKYMEYHILNKIRKEYNLIKNYYFENQYLWLNRCIDNLSKQILNEIDTSYCLIIQTLGTYWVIKDRLGNRPLFYSINRKCSELNMIKCLYVSSETCINKKLSWNTINADEILKISTSNNSMNLEFLKKNNYPKQKFCVFEKIYFMRKDSLLTNTTKVQQYRANLSDKFVNQLITKNSEYLLKFYNNDTIISGIPETGNEYGHVISNLLNLPYKQVIEKNIKYRTFICGSDRERIDSCKKKYKINYDIINGKNLILVDDSIVRGNTLKYLIENIKDNSKPKTITIFVLSPPVKYTCQYGVDIPTKEELIMNKFNNSIDDITNYIDVDKVIYLDIENIKDNNCCDHCFSGIDIL